ncbi:threonine synthase [Fodinibius halophilus]|uniref:Threonine synthase n=1 Tax=Fodinibius halophilus TaxID=1736908 RepID=A0A6M1TDD4_9BACT|nr:threonine synthase [Fodinibius halophilus]NGP88172.1 threonine synthase [Fodinibius halophilus]
MKFVSTKGEAEPVSFAQAALRGLAPDGGLYIPGAWPSFPGSFWDSIKTKSLQEISYAMARPFIDELSDNALHNIINDAINFEAPLVQLDEKRYVLELFHGPTLAFKDFGARFMARAFAALREQSEQDLVIIAATSGDTGSAVAQGFLGVEGIKVCLLYPAGKVSHIQEQQLTTAGQNVTALEVDGTFDDCQRMVKQAFSDSSLNEQLLLSSANSINIARLVPQMFYYGYALAQLRGNSAPILCVPSGNFGNLTAGLMAAKLGMPAAGFIAATNANDIVPEYLETGSFNPRDSKQTISNAMDVGRPSNFERMHYLFNGNHHKMEKTIWGTSFSDDETRAALKKVYEKTDYVMDPHTAVAHLAVEEYRETANGYFGEQKDTPFVMLSTAHPAKFGDVIEPVIGEEVEIPERLAVCLEKNKKSVALENDYSVLKKWLLDNYKGAL